MPRTGGCNIFIFHFYFYNLTTNKFKIFLIIFRFQLFYFSNTVIKAKKDTVLTIDTRGNKPNQTVDHDDADEVDEDPVEKAIQSK